MNIHESASPYAPSDLKRGLDALEQFGNMVYLVANKGPISQELLQSTIKQWDDSNPNAKAYAWDTVSEPDFKKSFVAIATIDQFREIEKNAVLANQLRFILCNQADLNIKREKRVLIIGATAFLGKAFYEVFGHAYLNVVGTGFGKAESMGMQYLDITNPEGVAKFFETNQEFDIVVYVSGEANADKAQVDQARAYALNTKPVELIAKYFSKGQFVYISTEYVFDGETAPYTSHSERKPKNYYGQTKKEAEDLTLQKFDHPIVIRMGALYGYNGPDDKKTTVAGIAQNIKTNQAIDIDELQIKHPIILEDAALTLIKLLDHKAEGIFQANGAMGVNKVELSKQMAKVWSEVGNSPYTASIAGNQKTDMSDKPRDTEMVNVDTPRSIGGGMRYMFDELKLESIKKV
ncbi:MAG: S-adenosylmethionine synthetase [Candidatus Omnitrophota bacterium]|jgi:S-adenosylmethionine synthetase